VAEVTAGDDAERSDAEERRHMTAGDDAERSDAEERRI
jgi:segregation and condensation protein B